MVLQSRSKENTEIFLWILYVLSLFLVWLNNSLHLSSIERYQHSFVFVNVWTAKVINLLFLITNCVFIRNIFTNKDRNISGVFPMFVYLFLHNQWWYFESINNYLISDFFILISLYFIGHHETKRKINILIFYLAVFFGLGFLLGINFIYAFIIPVFIFNLFLLSDWKSWIIFLLGFLVPVYFFVTISWLLDKDPFLFLRIVADHNFYRLKEWSLESIFYIRQMQWANAGLSVIILLLFISGLRELQDVGFYSGKERRMALFFFFLMFFSLINYFLLYFFYHKNAFSVIALPYAYYTGILLNKTSAQLRYFILFLIFLLTVFL